MNTKTDSIDINKWSAGMSLEFLGSTGIGDSKITAWKRSDGAVALETNGDPVYGDEADAWIADNI